MMSERDGGIAPAGSAPIDHAGALGPRDVSPVSPQWQQGMVVRMPPAKPIVKRPWVPKIWVIFAVLGLLLLLAPSVVTFLINLSPGDHSDNGDGQYWLSGLILVPCMIFGLPALFLAFCVGIGEWVVWVWTAHQQHVLSARMFIIPPVVIVVGYILVRLSAFALASLGI